jgi:hypothetical protein
MMVVMHFFEPLSSDAHDDCSSENLNSFQKTAPSSLVCISLVQPGGSGEVESIGAFICRKLFLKGFVSERVRLALFVHHITRLHVPFFGEQI